MNSNNTTPFSVKILPLIISVLFYITPLQAEERDNITIVFTSGLAEIYLDEQQGGYPHLKTFLQTVKKAEDKVLFLHGGDTLSPGILSTVDKGAHIISILNEIKPDVMAVSKSDLAHQEDALSLRSFEAAFPLINCNIYDPLTGSQPEGILPYFMKRVGNYNIGFLSVVDPEVIADYMPQRITTIDMKRAVTENSKILREKGADIVILIAGLTLDAFNMLVPNPPADMVLLSKRTGPAELKQQGNGLFALTGYEGIASLINVNIRKKDGLISWSSSGKTVILRDYAADGSLTAQIDSYLSQLSEILNQSIGTTATSIDTRRESVRTGENGFANLATDALREHFNSDIALINGGGFRADKVYPANSLISVGDIQKELPFHNRVVNIRVTGDVLRKSLERGLSRIEELKGCFPHISGMRVQFDPSKPPLQRVTSITIGGRKLDPQKKYTLTTIDYLAKGGDGYEELKNAERVIKVGENRLLWEYIRNYIAEHRVIAPKLDGRMQATKG